MSFVALTFGMQVPIKWAGPNAVSENSLILIVEKKNIHVAMDNVGIGPRVSMDNLDLCSRKVFFLVHFRKS